MGGRQSRSEAVTVDDDYKVLRQALWSETDDAYKNAIEKLEAKKRFCNKIPSKIALQIFRKNHLSPPLISRFALNAMLKNGAT